MKVFVTGGTGFVGQELIHQLLNTPHSVRMLCRTIPTTPNSNNIETVQGDVTQPDSLEELLAGCDAVINLVGIIREIPSRGVNFHQLHTEATRNLLHASKRQGVSRYIQMSANGVRTNATSNYHKSKWAAEGLVRKSELDWTIFRPSLIFGPGDQFVNLLAGLIKSLPLVPVMGDGNYRMQPVSVKDVARSFIAALEVPESIGQTYHCGGPTSYSYNEILDLIGQALGKKTSVHKLHHPLWLMKPVVAAMQSLPQFPMTSDQLQMLLEGNCCDPRAWRDIFQLDLTEFPAGIKAYLT